MASATSNIEKGSCGMTTSLVAQSALRPTAKPVARESAANRDIAIDTMRGAAILMVIGIHSLPQPPNAWETIADAILRPSVPIFLFVSGYLSALSGKVPLWRRLKTALVPYAIAFAVAYIYMAVHNPSMDHRLTTALARFILAYVFVYYFVFVYVGCTVGLWLAFRLIPSGPSNTRLAGFLLLAIVFGLTSGAYLDPLSYRLGFGESLVEEIRMRDIPFWFAFMALGALAGMFRIQPMLAAIRLQIWAATLTAYILYTAVRLLQIGDAADYDSIAFFGCAALLCFLLLALDVELPLVAWFGSGSYFIYLWHIFFVMLLRDHTSLRQMTPFFASTITFICAASASILAMLIVRALAPASLRRWLGA
jgi:fucose 4-O-acetylase-like acetyltransferase